jgi:phosphohistidine phosphatase
MKRVLLLRHAEARAAQGTEADFDRPLSERGRSAAHAAAQRIATSGLHIDVLYVSPAARTLQTAQIVAAGLAAAERLRLEPTLYPGTPEHLWAALQRLDEQVRCALLVGHNPSLSVLAGRWGLCAPGRELPTAGLGLAGFPPDIRWSALTWDQATPLELPAGS